MNDIKECRQQREASYYFDFDSIKKRNNDISENIIILEESIKKTKEDIAFMDVLYEFLEDFNYSHNEYIVDKDLSYDTAMNDAMLLAISEYFIFHMDKYYIKTAEDNHRNWVYASEINDERERLEKYLTQLEEKMRKKNVNIGVEIALLTLV